MIRKLTAILLALALTVPLLLAGNVIVIRRAAGTTYPLDWSGSFTAWWDLEEDGSSTRVATGGTCASGSTCDLTTFDSDDSNQVARGTGVVGSYAASFETDPVNEDEDLRCTGCTAIMTYSDVDVEWGCFVRPEGSMGTTRTVIANVGSGNGIKASYTTSFACEAQGTGETSYASGVGTAAADTWFFFMCSFDYSATTLYNYVYSGASTEASTSTEHAVIDSQTSRFTVSRDIGNMDGLLDMCFMRVDDDVLTATQRCRICSCGIDGSAGPCVCDGTAYNDEGLNDSDCGGCTLPDCDAAAP